MPHTHEAEAAHAAREQPIGCAVLTISDTRTKETDISGKVIRSILDEHGFKTNASDIVPDDSAAIQKQLEVWIADESIDVILTTGGTGIARRDNTIALVRPLLTIELNGFGELFRMVSFDEVGAAAMLSNAIGGLVEGARADKRNDTFIFAMPGSKNAVETAMRMLIAPQLAHLVYERRK